MGLLNKKDARLRAYENMIAQKMTQLEELQIKYNNEIIRLQSKEIIKDISENDHTSVFVKVSDKAVNIDLILEEIDGLKQDIELLENSRRRYEGE